MISFFLGSGCPQRVETPPVDRPLGLEFQPDSVDLLVDSVVQPDQTSRRAEVQRSAQYSYSIPQFHSGLRNYYDPISFRVCRTGIGIPKVVRWHEIDGRWLTVWPLVGNPDF